MVHDIYFLFYGRASKGLFLGILVLVASIINLILFFVLINKHGFKQTAILSASMTELVLYGVTILAIVVGMMQIQRLRCDVIPEIRTRRDNPYLTAPGSHSEIV